jgi:hypothetical protein
VVEAARTTAARAKRELIVIGSVAARAAGLFVIHTRECHPAHHRVHLAIGRSSKARQ